MHFCWKIKWWLEHLGALGLMSKMAPLIFYSTFYKVRKSHAELSLTVVLTCTSASKCHIQLRHPLEVFDKTSTIEKIQVF